MKIILTSDTHYGHSSKTHRRHEKFLRKVNNEKPDLLIHAGDWASNRQHQFYRSMKMFKESLDCPIFAVRGNHDFWQLREKGKSKLSIEELVRQHEAWFRELGIHHASLGELKLGGFNFYGFDGWYRSVNPPTNDEAMLPFTNEGLTTMERLTRKAYVDLANLLDTLSGEKEKRVLVTHFPPFTENPFYRDMNGNENYLPIFEEHFGYLMCGHSHKECDWEYKSLHIYNSGADYDAPRFKVINLS